jgi:aminopeptidase YwaD
MAPWRIFMNKLILRQEVFRKTQDLINQHGPRLAGTESDLHAADTLYEDMKSFADHAHQDDFYIHQGAFLGWIRILVFNFISGTILLWFGYYWITALLAFASVMILYIQFILYKPMLDRFYPKKKAKNVYGVIEPEGEVLQDIIISGHHDSAHVFNFFIHQPKLYNLRTTGSIALVFGLLLTSTLLHFLPNIVILTWIIRVLSSLSVLLVGQMWFFSSKKGTPGAGDNLVATMIAIALGRHFAELKREKKGLKHTRLWIVSFDAEEEGLRGARAFAKKHQVMLKKHPAYLLNADCLYDEKELFFLTSDLNDTVKLDTELTSDLVEIASSLNVKTKTQNLAFLTGGTDAAELAKIGVKSTTLIGMPWTNSNRSAVYHTPKDTLDHVSPKVVEDSINIFYNYIIQKDKKIPSSQNK